MGASAGADLEAAGAPAEASVDTPADQGEVQIPSDVLPPGIKEGDRLRCTAMGENGCSFVLEPGESPKEESWESDFRKEMSPQSPQQEAM